MTGAIDYTERVRGVLVGLAVADAVGAPVEFDSPERITGKRDELFAMPGGGSFGWAPGEFTDDTQMTIVLARHLRDCGGEIDQDMLVQSFVEWRDAAADVGIQTRYVLDAVRRGESWHHAVAALKPDSAGNGSLMRVAPVAIAATSGDNAMALARRQSEVTHPNQWCSDACAVFASLLWDMIRGTSVTVEELARRAATPRITEAVRAAIRPEPPTMSGFVVHTLTGALWAVYGAASYEDAVWRAVSLGEDADTVAAVAGAFAGARWGLSSIPTTLSGRLQSRHPLFRDDYPDALVALADALATGSTGTGSNGSSHVDDGR